ncbi:MEDS domain-containing protein [Herbiconiux daphne]|uniref:MEDS domain-containing protein n=1 Tax=Herbiconiux daphne TaxID=2970914 RepID=A0ABT2H5M3_9MICO|nr:MEDS domain-containing protein [Herbiconiux daphne]MCS5735247.1 MEDS domain-containing protein [Herbiconiux daphne]
MAGADRAATDPATFAGGVLDRYRHVCAFVNGPQEQDAVLDPFVRQGVDRGDRLVYLVDPAESAGPVNRLRHLGYDAAGLLEGHRCEVHTWTDTYLRGGHFDQDDMLDLLDEMLVRQRPPRIRLVADMGWAADRRDVADSLIEFEARANFIHARHEHVVICSYDVARFDGAFIIDILRTHPLVLIGGVLQVNPFFLPPSEFIEERSARGSPRRSDGPTRPT